MDSTQRIDQYDDTTQAEIRRMMFDQKQKVLLWCGQSGFMFSLSVTITVETWIATISRLSKLKTCDDVSIFEPVIMYLAA